VDQIQIGEGQELRPGFKHRVTSHAGLLKRDFFPMSQAGSQEPAFPFWHPKPLRDF
jgi:hypothetical protein